MSQRHEGDFLTEVILYLPNKEDILNFLCVSKKTQNILCTKKINPWNTREVLCCDDFNEKITNYECISKVFASLDTLVIDSSSLQHILQKNIPIVGKCIWLTDRHPSLFEDNSLIMSKLCIHQLLKQSPHQLFDTQNVELLQLKYTRDAITIITKALQDKNQLNYKNLKYIHFTGCELTMPPDESSKVDCELLIQLVQLKQTLHINLNYLITRFGLYKIIDNHREQLLTCSSQISFTLDTFVNGFKIVVINRINTLSYNNWCKEYPDLCTDLIPSRYCSSLLYYPTNAKKFSTVAEQLYLLPAAKLNVAEYIDVDLTPFKYMTQFYLLSNSSHTIALPSNLVSLTLQSSSGFNVSHSISNWTSLTRLTTIHNYTKTDIPQEYQHIVAKDTQSSECQESFDDSSDFDVSDDNNDSNCDE